MNYYTNNYYNYYSYYKYLNDWRDYYPDIARLPYGYLIYISNQTNLRINPGVFDLEKTNEFFKINCHAKFRCSICHKIWTSNKVTIELWWGWIRNKKEFDVRMYGQKCKYCNKKFMKPYVVYDDICRIIDKFIDVLITNNYERRKNYNKNINKVNSSHKKEKCQKCIILGYPCF